MKNSIYTRTGDKGETSLVDSSRVPKDARRVEAYGTVDEANSWVGVARACTNHPVLRQSLDFLQHRLFNCSSNLATPQGCGFEPPRISEEDVAFLEQAIDHFESKTGPLTFFILPGGNQCSGYLHVARTTTRRAERRIVSLSADEPVDALVLKFVNRASDFLFAAARYSNYIRSREDVRWRKDIEPPKLSDEPDSEASLQGDEGCDSCSSS
jgi:cob(I)alamin adenosyltransferase